MEKLRNFVSEHISDDVTRLVLDRKKWPEIDMELAVACIESRRKLKGKVQQWYDNPDLVFPFKLSAEQCSSSATGVYKAALAETIAMSSMEDLQVMAEGEGHPSWSIADLTGGLGVDSWFFSQKASRVLYNEMQKPLCEAARHNFKVLGADNIIISNHAVISAGSATGSEAASVQEESGATPDMILKDFRPDIVYMDPARRGEGGKKVFLIEECTPDVLTLKDEIFSLSRHMLIKLSPMADITMACDRLGSCCREVHVVASGGECKELLIWMDREWDAEYEIIAVELHNDRQAASFRFRPSQEQSGRASAGLHIAEECRKGKFLFEPGKALMKAGAYNMISQQFGIDKLGQSTHYYITDDITRAEELRKYGKVFIIKDCQPLDKRSMKAFGKAWPNADVTARNIPMTSETLRKKTGCKDGGSVHIFGLKSDTEGVLLIAAEKHII